MNGSGMIMFRTSRKGYDKGDVHRYIEEMNIRFASAEEKAKQQIRRLEAELEKASLGETPVDETALQALSQENEALKAELEALRAALADAKRESPAEAEAEEKTTLTYDDASKRLGDILLKANLDADRIVAEAEAEANRQLSGAEKQADDIRLDAAVTARVMTDRVKQRLTALTEDYVNSLESFSRASAVEYRRLFDELKSRLDTAHVEAAVILREAKNGLGE